MLLNEKSFTSNEPKKTYKQSKSTIENDLYKEILKCIGMMMLFGLFFTFLVIGIQFFYVNGINGLTANEWFYYVKLFYFSCWIYPFLSYGWMWINCEDETNQCTKSCVNCIRTSHELANLLKNASLSVSEMYDKETQYSMENINMKSNLRSTKRFSIIQLESININRNETPTRTVIQQTSSIEFQRLSPVRNWEMIDRRSDSNSNSEDDFCNNASKNPSSTISRPICDCKRCTIGTYYSVPNETACRGPFTLKSSTNPCGSVFFKK